MDGAAPPPPHAPLRSRSAAAAPTDAGVQLGGGNQEAVRESVKEYYGEASGGGWAE